MIIIAVTLREGRGALCPVLTSHRADAMEMLTMHTLKEPILVAAFKEPILVAAFKEPISKEPILVALNPRSSDKGCGAVWQVCGI